METIDYFNYKLSRKEKTDCIITVFILASVILYLFYRSLLMIPVAAAAAALSPGVYGRMLAAKRREMLLTQFQDLLYSVSGSVSAGRHMGEALSEACDSLSLLYAEDTPMMQELDRMMTLRSVSNAGDEELLKELGKRSGIRDISTFADVYYIARDTGGDLVHVVNLASSMLTDKFQVRRDIRAYVAQKKFEGMVISLMPPCMLLMLNMMSSEYLEPLYTTSAGRLVMTLALAAEAAGFYISYRITDIGVFDEEKGTGKTKKQHAGGAAGASEHSGAASVGRPCADSGRGKDRGGRRRFISDVFAPGDHGKNARE